MKMRNKTLGLILGLLFVGVLLVNHNTENTHFKPVKKAEATLTAVNMKLTETTNWWMCKLDTKKCDVHAQVPKN